ncbi:MAG: acyltransferase family protein, partial [Acidimicrobiia bacterium]
MPHLRPLDGLRGIAVLAVVLYHFSPDIAPGGFLGVDIFFVLSGFLITSLLVNERERSHAISLLRFWIRRARRLLPALILVLLAVGLSTLVMSDHSQARRIDVDSLFALGYLANWRFIWSGQSYVEQILRTTPSPIRHTWSLAIEEQFYLVWPLVVVGVSAVVARISGARNGHVLFRRAVVGVCVVLGTLSFVRMVTVFSSTGDANRVYYGTDTHAFLLLAGAALGALSAGAPFLARRTPRVLLIVAGCAASVALVVIMANLDATSRGLYQGKYAAIGVLIVVVLAAAAQPGTNPLGRLFSIRPLVGLGLISYGVYLWHWPIVVWLTPERTGLDDGVALFALRAVLTLAVSLASYFLVEQPIRQGRMLRTWTSVPSFAALGVVSAMVIVLVAPVVFFPSVNSAPRVAPSQSSTVTTADYASGARCDETASSLPKLPAGTAPKVELFGNSVAIEVADCLATLVEARGGTFETVTHSGRAPCLLMDDLRKQVADPATRPDIAIFSAAIIHTELDCTKGDNLWLDQVNEALGIWKQAGVKVYLVPIVPNIPGTEPPNPSDVNWSVPTQHPEFDQLAAADPTHVGLIDGGIFIRDAEGAYQWRMPCLPGGEPGCAADGTIGVRWVDGFHFCTTTQWD